MAAVIIMVLASVLIALVVCRWEIYNSVVESIVPRNSPSLIQLHIHTVKAFILFDNSYGFIVPLFIHKYASSVSATFAHKTKENQSDRDQTSDAFWRFAGVLVSF